MLNRRTMLIHLNFIRRGCIVKLKAYRVPFKNLNTIYGAFEHQVQVFLQKRCSQILVFHLFHSAYANCTSIIHQIGVWHTCLLRTTGNDMAQILEGDEAISMCDQNIRNCGFSKLSLQVLTFLSEMINDKLQYVIVIIN